MVELEYAQRKMAGMVRQMQWLLLVEAIKQTRIFQLAVKVIGDGVVVKSRKIIICMEKENRKKLFIASLNGRVEFEDKRD